MSEKELKKTIDIVSGIEVNSEAEAIAKETLISYVEQLHQENEQLKNKIKQIIEFIEVKIKIIKALFDPSLDDVEIWPLKSSLDRCQEILDFINKGGLDE